MLCGQLVDVLLNRNNAMSSATRRSRSPARRSRTNDDECLPLVCFPGGGTFFWWQVGAATALTELYDLDGLLQPGFSAGALAAVFGVCGVDPCAPRGLQIPDITLTTSLIRLDAYRYLTCVCVCVCKQV